MIMSDLWKKESVLLSSQDKALAEAIATMTKGDITEILSYLANPELRAQYLLDIRDKAKLRKSTAEEVLENLKLVRG